MCDNKEISLIMEMLHKIDEKLDNVIPRVNLIESKLKMLDVAQVNTELSEIKSTTSELLLEVRDTVKSVDSLSDRRVIDSSDSISELSDLQSDQGNNEQASAKTQAQCDKFGLLMSDCDMTEMATNMGKLLDCQVTMFDYSVNTLSPNLFDKQLEFVVIQGSGKLLDRYEEITPDVVQELTAHVKELVNVATNILELNPGTKVFLGSLPPRYDGRLRVDLARVFNGLLVTESFVEERIVVICQSQLNCCRDEKKMRERYEEDMVTLTRYGMSLRDKNIAMQMAKAVTGLTVVRNKKYHLRKQHFLQGGYKKYSNERYQFKSFLTDIMQRL